MNAPSSRETNALALVSDEDIMLTLKNSLYPGASDASCNMVLAYCRAAGLDPIQKPVHIVGMWNKAQKCMVDVIMPGIGSYRITASRTGQYAGCSEPEFGPDVEREIGGMTVYYPAWCRVTVRRRLASGELCEFTAKEFWVENYATAGKDNPAPNSMWAKRPYAQLAKCAEAQALRKGFPEVGSQNTADEMEGKSIDSDYSVPAAETAGRKPTVAMPQAKPPEPTPGATVAPESKTDVQDVQDKRAQAEDTGELASVGEVAFITKKINAKFQTIADAKVAAGLDAVDSLAGLTKAQFVALRDACK